MSGHNPATWCYCGQCGTFHEFGHHVPRDKPRTGDYTVAAETEYGSFTVIAEVRHVEVEPS